MDKYEFYCRIEYLSSIYKQILDPLFQGYDIHLAGAGESGKAALMKVLTYKKESVIFREKYPSHELFYLEKDTSENELSLWYQLALQMDVETTGSLEVIFPKILARVRELTRKENKFVFITCNQVPKWKFFDESLVESFATLARVYESRINYVFITDSCTADDDSKIFKKLQMVMNMKKVMMPLLYPEDIEHMYVRNRREMDLSTEFDDEIIKNLYRLSGGIPGIIKRLLYLDERTLRKSAKEIIKSGSMYQEVLRVLADMDKKNLTDLKNNKFNNELYESDLIDKKGRIKSSLLGEVVSNYDVEKFLIVGEDPKDVLSPQELGVFNLLKEKLGVIVSREDIAKELWGKDYSQKYSDWALDSLIRRLRKKLPSKNIVTVRGKGVYLEK